MRYCFVFVCQKGDLEIKSLLLAASLKRYLQCDYELVAAIPEPEAIWGIPSATTMEMLAGMNVRVMKITNNININYPIGNKISCLDAQTSAEKLVFIDSDILCSKEFPGDERFLIPFNAKPADVPTFTNDLNVWSRVYGKFGLSVPDRRMITTVTQELTAPYFNAGFIAVNRDAGLGSEWLEVCKQIDADPTIANKRPWLDQVGLPVALEKLGIEYDCLGDDYNFPLNLKTIRNGEMPYFCHYHNPVFIRQEQKVNGLFLELIDLYPDIGRLLSTDDAWSSLARPFKLGQRDKAVYSEAPVQTSGSTRDGIITGIPRSGTSYLCALLNKVKNCVAINEPGEIFPVLKNHIVPFGMAVYYRSIRGKILDGEPIENKLQNGEPIEDTSVIDGREKHVPAVYSEDFALFTKNTLAYSSHISGLRRVMPYAPIFACVRNPYDTIASWKESFPHLRDADVTKFFLGGINDPFLSGVERYLLMQIASCKSESVRRALLWRYLAERIIAQKNDLAIVRYEDTVKNPVDVINTILDAFPAGKAEFGIPAIEKSEIRSKRHALTKDDYIAISSLCMDVANEFGYECVR